MKANKARTSNTAVGVVLVIFLCLSAAVFFFSSSETHKYPFATTYSTHPGGLKALYLLLDEQGWDVRRLKRDYTDLPEGAGVLVLAAPRFDVSAEEVDALRAWVERGGVLITTMPCDQAAFAKLDFEGPCGMALLNRNKVRVNPGPGLLDGVKTMGPAAPRQFTRTPREFVPLIFDGADIFAGVARMGDGAIYVLPVDTVFSNSGLDEHDNARLAYNVFSSLDANAAIYFDEYHQGFTTGGPGPGGMSLLQAAFGTPYGLFLTQLILAALLLLLNRHGLKKRQPRANLSATPLAFAGAAAGLYRRSGAHAHSAARMILMARRDLVRRRNLPPDTPLQEIADLFPQSDERHKVLHGLARYQEAIRGGRTVAPDQAVRIAQDIAWINQSFEESHHAEL
jgi:hypothetical protein